MMKLLQQNEIDRERWNRLVLSQPDALIYHQSIFLDELAEHWMLLVDENYSLGIPLPYTIRLGQKQLYTPNFIRALDWVGEAKNMSTEMVHEARNLIETAFKYAAFRMDRNWFGSLQPERSYQVLERQFELNEQAKRSIKKFEKSDLELFVPELSEILPIVIMELLAKVKDLKKQDVDRLTKLLTTYPAEQLWLLGVKNEHEILGGMIFIPWKNTLNYVKGGCVEEAKHNGAMFAMMLDAINYAQKNELKLDFGGSNVEGVRRFNLAFGATDRAYFEHTFDHLPCWFKWLRRLRKKPN